MDPAARIAQKMAALAGMGFQRVESAPISTESVRVGRDAFKVTCSRAAMGTLVSITALDASRDRAEEAIGQAFQEMDRVVGLLNRHDGASAVSSLNSQGVLQLAPPELFDVLNQARYHYELSGGSFDVTVQPLVDLFRSHLTQDRARWEAAESHASAPTPQEVMEALDLVNGRQVEIKERCVRLGRDGMGLTLDGIAKGYVVDRVAKTLAGFGISDYLISAGGDIRTAGRREDGEAWRVAVQDPDKRGTFPDVIEVSDGAVATSGSYEIYFDRERTYHHIVDTETGGSPQLSQSVSVMAPSTVTADALATSVFVMEPERAIALIDSLPQCACLIVDSNGRQLRSVRWRSADEPPTRKAGEE